MEYKESQAPSSVDSFQSWRREIIDDLLFAQKFTALEQLVGIAIAYSINKQTRVTFEGCARFARRLHLKVREVEKAIDGLVTKGRLEIEHYRNKPHLKFVGQSNPSRRSTGGPKSFYSKRGSFCEAILTFPLTPAARIAYIGLAAMTDSKTGAFTEGGAWLGRQIGLSKFAMTSAIKALALAGLLTSKGAEGLPSIISLRDPRNPATGSASGSATHPATTRPATGEKSITYTPTTVTPVSSVSIPSPSDSDHTAARRGRGVNLDRFIALYDLMTGSYAHHDERQTIGGIVRLSSGEFDWVCSDSFSASEIQAFVRAGLLARDGQWVEITPAGHDAAAPYFNFAKAA